MISPFIVTFPEYTSSAELSPDPNVDDIFSKSESIIMVPLVPVSTLRTCCKSGCTPDVPISPLHLI